MKIIENSFGIDKQKCLLCDMNKQKIYLLAEQKGMKISFIIGKSGVSRKSFYDYLNGNITPPTDVLLNTANTLGVTIDAIKA